MKTITVADKEYEMVLDDNHVAFDQNNNRFDVYESKETFIAGGCIGSVRAIFDEQDEIISYSYPMLGFDKDFDLVSKDQMNKWKERLQENILTPSPPSPEIMELCRKVSEDCSKLSDEEKVKLENSFLKRLYG